MILTFVPNIGETHLKYFPNLLTLKRLVFFKHLLKETFSLTRLINSLYFTMMLFLSLKGGDILHDHQRADGFWNYES